MEEARDFLSVAHHADEPCEQDQEVHHGVRLSRPWQMPNWDRQNQKNLEAHGSPKMELWLREHALEEGLWASIPKREGPLFLVLREELSICVSCLIQR